MSSSKRKTRRRQRTLSGHGRGHEAGAGELLSPLGPDEAARRDRWFQIGALVILLAFGIYKAVALFGAYAVPNPDFGGFVGVGKRILSFQIPTSFKRAPVVGMLQVMLSKFVSDDQPLLTAGWLLNAILTPLNVILVWQVGKKLIGNAAILLAIVVTLNPWFLRSQVNPIAETTMIFCILATLYFCFRRSSWAYLFASIGSMVRYECTILIVIAFAMDMITRETKKERIRAFVFAGLASVPFLLWMLGTRLYWDRQKSHYLGHYGHGAVGMGYVKMLWEAAFMTLFKLPAGARAAVQGVSSQEALDALNASRKVLWVVSQVVVVISLFAGLTWAAIKRNWYVLSVWVFLVFYTLVHAMRSASHHRYCVPAVWALVLLAGFGMQACWRLINAKGRVPKPVRVALKSIVIVAAVIWVAGLIPNMNALAPRCVQGKWLPWAAMGAAAGVVILGAGLFRFRRPTGVALAAVVCLMVVSQHFMTIRIIDNGAYYVEFKYFLDWCKENTEPGEKIATRWTGTLRYMSVSRARDLVSLTSVAGESFEEFIENCYAKDIAYVAYTPRGSAGTKIGLEHLGLPLANKEQKMFVGPLKMVQRFQVGKAYINVYKLQPRVGRPGD